MHPFVRWCFAIGSESYDCSYPRAAYNYIPPLMYLVIAVFSVLNNLLHALRRENWQQKHRATQVTDADKENHEPPRSCSYRAKDALTITASPRRCRLRGVRWNVEAKCQ
mmetsp:Transcript_161777/g.310721  ORF Transcript_161777/g.310721 Transcript_161777/m.310721 type:complete len:109 (-) Transcript_161777:1683-2009(-)